MSFSTYRWLHICSKEIAKTCRRIEGRVSLVALFGHAVPHYLIETVFCVVKQLSYYRNRYLCGKNECDFVAISNFVFFQGKWHCEKCGRTQYWDTIITW